MLDVGDLVHLPGAGAELAREFGGAAAAEIGLFGGDEGVGEDEPAEFVAGELGEWIEAGVEPAADDVVGMNGEGEGTVPDGGGQGFVGGAVDELLGAWYGEFR